MEESAKVIAFVDESVREAGVGTYVVGCVIAPDTECTDLRGQLTSRGRFHFHRENEERTQEMLANLGTWKLATGAYVFRGLYSTGQPRARNLCLKRLLWDLMTWDVDDLVIESRQPHNDRRDAILIIGAQRAKAAAPKLRYRWEKPLADPLLWTADAIAGAVMATMGRPPRYASELGSLGTGIRHLR